MSVDDDFRVALSRTTTSLDACVVVGGHLMALNFDNLAEATRRGVKIRILFPFPEADWLAPMIAATTAGRAEYARRINTNAARAGILGPSVEVRWHDSPIAAWFTILDATRVAHKAISFATMARPSITNEAHVLAYHQRLFDALWNSAERTPPATKPDPPELPRESVDARGVFLSYADEDRQHFDAIHSHLVSTLRTKLIRCWHRGLITAGDVYRKEIARYIERSQVIVLLMSAQWFASGICQDEFQLALALSDCGRARVVPVLVRPCRVEDTPRLAELAQLPKNRVAVTLWPNADEAWTHVVNDVATLTELR